MYDEIVWHVADVLLGKRLVVAYDKNVWQVAEVLLGERLVVAYDKIVWQVAEVLLGKRLVVACDGIRASEAQPDCNSALSPGHRTVAARRKGRGWVE